MGLGNDGSLDDGRIRLPIWLHVGILACGANSWINRNSRCYNASNASGRAHALGNLSVDFFDCQLCWHGRIHGRRVAGHSWWRLGVELASPICLISKTFKRLRENFESEGDRIEDWHCDKH